eukprot:1307804-Rhodomonas_salina.1
MLLVCVQHRPATALHATQQTVESNPCGTALSESADRLLCAHAMPGTAIIEFTAAPGHGHRRMVTSQGRVVTGAFAPGTTRRTASRPIWRSQNTRSRAPSRCQLPPPSAPP